LLKGFFVASYNRIIIIGNLTRDPDYKQLPSGQPVSRLGLACNRNYKNKQTGAMVQEVCFIDVDVFGPQAESCRQYLQKGRPVLVEGRLKFDTWQSPDGQTRSKHSIVADRVVFLGSAGSGAGLESDTEASAENNTPAQDLSDPNVMAAHEQLGRVQNKKRSGAYAATNFSQEKPATAAGEFDFKDEPPFQDDLPF
jgi:single-strand DNA-binding protein